MNTTLVRSYFAAYGLHPLELSELQKGYRNVSHAALLPDGRQVNFILYKDEPGILLRIQRANSVTLALAKTSLPVRYPLDRRILQLKSPAKTLHGALYNYLPGKTIPWEGYTKAHIKLVGMAMSTMHFRMRKINNISNEVALEYQNTLRHMQAYFKDTNVRQAMRQKLGITLSLPYKRLYGLLAFCQMLPHQQVLHMDFVRGNLLFNTANSRDQFVINGLALSGVIDFEKVAWGHPLFDVARSLAFLLVDCPNKSSAQIKKYFLQSGYNKRGEAKFINVVVTHGKNKIDILEEMVAFFLLHDFYKFLRHNPYESLPNNHHFIRTQNILLERKMLQCC